MHREGDSMALLGLPVDGARDRNFPSTISKIQCWFIENRVQVNKIILIKKLILERIEPITIASALPEKYQRRGNQFG